MTGSRSETPLTKQLQARIRRWWYLLTRGMWRGERAVDYTYADGRLSMLTTENGDGVKVWWHIHER